MFSISVPAGITSGDCAIVKSSMIVAPVDAANVVYGTVTVRPLTADSSTVRFTVVTLSRTVDDEIWNPTVGSGSLSTRVCMRTPSPVLISALTGFASVIVTSSGSSSSRSSIGARSIVCDIVPGANTTVPAARL